MELVLLLKFPREVFHLAPPVPITPDEGPQVAFEFGRIGFYFDRWDAPDPDLVDGPRAMANTFYIHLTLGARLLPEKLELALTVPAHPYASAICSEPWEDDEPDDVARAAELCDRMFSDPALEDYLARLGEHVLETIVDFLTILRVGYGQYLIPRGLPVTTARNHWMLADGTRREVSGLFLDRLLGLRRWDDPGDINDALQPEHWPEIAARLGARRTPAFSEILLASALGQCDPELGNPRLALAEAVGALEVEAQALLAVSQQRNGIARPRAAPYSRLAWIREHLGRAGGVDDALYRRCAQALRARDVLAEREVRALALEQVRIHVEALGQLTRLARRAREGTD